MQILKDTTRQRILAIAHKEFINNGVRNTSIRTIASKAGIAVGNVYNYFESKDKLFCEVMQPLINAVDAHILSHNKEQHLSIDIFHMQDFQDSYIIKMKTLIKKFRPELKLLLFNANETSLAGYKERLISHQMKIGLEYMQLMKERYPHINTNISPFFLHIACSTWMTLFTELVEHEEYSEKEIDYALEQYAIYSIAGWEKLMKP